jgi:hypothetical protein
MKLNVYNSSKVKKTIMIYILKSLMIYILKIK